MGQITPKRKPGKAADAGSSGAYYPRGIGGTAGLLSCRRCHPQGQSFLGTEKPAWYMGHVVSV